jgi:carboxyl-terminal processing protease
MGAIVIIMALFYGLTLRNAQQDSVYRTYAPLVEVDALIRHNYIGHVDPAALIDGAIRGALLELDPYSRYIAPDELEAFRRKMAAEYTGIGVEIGMRHGRLTVITPIEESPAARAGILAGDVILAIDGQSAEGMSVPDADALLAGAPGSTVTLIVRHPSEDQIQTSTITRGSISMQPVKGFRRTAAGSWDYLIDPRLRIGYIRVSSFRENTTVAFDDALSELKEAGVRGIVLDLRFNGGGYLPRAVEMADRFIPSGTIVSTVKQKTVDRYRAKKEGTLPPVELVVLINGASASAAEIVAGALQDHGRATLVGTRSFGKGSVQQERRLRGRGASVWLTEAYYELPLGRIIHRTPDNTGTENWGVIPDIRVPLTAAQRREVQASRRAADGAGLTSQAIRPNQPLTTGPTDPPFRQIWIDPQLQTGVDLLAERLEVGQSARTRTAARGQAH